MTRPPLSVQDAIRQSATDVDIDELSRRGLRKVKVLDKETVFRLIDEAVNRVVEERLKAATAQERQTQVQAEVDQQVAEYQIRIRQLEEQVHQGAIPAAASIDKEMLGAMIREAVAGVAPQGGSGDLLALQKSIESLSKKVGNASGRATVDAPPEETIEALFSRKTADVESNINAVEVKNAKAGNVNKHLAKLKSMKKGSE